MSACGKGADACCCGCVSLLKSFCMAPSRPLPACTPAYPHVVNLACGNSVTQPSVKISLQLRGHMQWYRAPFNGYGRTYLAMHTANAARDKQQKDQLVPMSSCSCCCLPSCLLSTSTMKHTPVACRTDTRGIRVKNALDRQSGLWCTWTDL